MQLHYLASLHRDCMKNSIWNLFNSREHYPNTQGNNNTILHSELSFNNKQNRLKLTWVIEQLGGEGEGIE